MQDTEPISSEFSEAQYGSYRVMHPLGAGGMSSVYRAVHVDSGHEVALKVLPERMAKNPIVLQRFLREARTAESLEHPNIVSIFDRGVDHGRNYLVLEYVDGCDLHDYVQTRGPLSAAEAIGITRQVAEGLRFGAAKGLIHRDIKPSNILRSKQGEIKITDLGLALQTEFEDERVTREGTTVGTVDYMAPEQARDSRAASSQSDLYSLGCTLYYLLTGIPPYPGGDITDKLTRHARSAPPDIRDLRPDVPEALARIMLRMMAKRTEDRFASFEELIQALDSVPLRDGEDSPGVALVPLDEPDPNDSRTSGRPWWSARDPGRSGCPPAIVDPGDLAGELTARRGCESALQHLHPRSGRGARTGSLAATGRDAICPRASRVRPSSTRATRISRRCPPLRGFRFAWPSGPRSSSW